MPQWGALVQAGMTGWVDGVLAPHACTASGPCSDTGRQLDPTVLTVAWQPSTSRARQHKPGQEGLTALSSRQSSCTLEAKLL